MIHRPVILKFILRLVGGPKPWRKSAFGSKLVKRNVTK